MKLKKYLNRLRKSLPRLLLCSLLATLTACSLLDTTATFSRKDIVSIIKDICAKEFNIDVQVWETGDTVWVYTPSEKILDKDNKKIDDEILKKWRQVLLSIHRSFLSMDKPPRFYCFVITDIKRTGVDVYQIGFFHDIMKLQTGYISQGQWMERVYFVDMVSPEAIADTRGDHISRYDITMGEFIALLIRQNVQKTFLEESIKDKVQINEIRSYYASNKIGILFNIVTKEYNADIPNAFDVAKNAAKKFLKIYEPFQNIVEIEISDLRTKKRRVFTHAALFED